MRGFLINILVAVVWALFAGEVSVRELAIGFLIGFGIQAIFPQALGTRSYIERTYAWIRFVGFFLKELMTANVQVALFALSPRPPLNSMIVDYPVRLRGDTSQTMFVAVLTLMPGSVVIGFNADRTKLYAHAIGFRTAQAAKASFGKVEDFMLPLFNKA